MYRALSYLPLALLFLASVVPSDGQKLEIPILSAAPVRRSEPDPTSERTLTVKLGAPLTVECSLQPQQKVEWRLDGGARPQDMKPVETTSSPEVVIARLTAPSALAHHAGVYTCAKSSPRIRVKITGTESTTGAPETPALPVEDFQGELKFYDVRVKFELNCTKLIGKVNWKVNGTDLDQRADLKEHLAPTTVEGSEGGLLKVTGRSTELDFGNYSCTNGAEVFGFMVKANLHAKLPTDSNVVEGQNLKLACKVIGRPCKGVQWTYSNVSAELANTTDVQSAFGARVKLAPNDQGIANAELTITSAERSDAGWYMCTPITDGDGATTTSSVTQLRVKDMYAALWPFLGICAEVFVLCAVILVYEKRRTKPELDDSDTDNHDQKKS